MDLIYENEETGLSVYRSYRSTEELSWEQAATDLLAGKEIIALEQDCPEDEEFGDYITLSKSDFPDYVQNDYFEIKDWIRLYQCFYAVASTLKTPETK